MQSGNMQSGNMQSGNMQSGNMQSGNMQSGNMQSGNMQSGNMQSGNMQSGNMQSGNMQSGNNMNLNINDYADQRLIIKNKCQSQDDCSICYEPFNMRQVVHLPCKHFFHNSCFKQTLEHKSYKCALCRFDITPALEKSGFKFPPGTAFGGTAALAPAALAPAALIEFSEFDFMPDLISDSDDSDDSTAHSADDAAHSADDAAHSADAAAHAAASVATADADADADAAIDNQLHENFWTNILLHMNEQPNLVVGNDFEDISYNSFMLYFYL